MIQVTAFDAVALDARATCLSISVFDNDVELLRWQGSTFVYRTPTLSGAIALRDHLKGRIPGVTIRFANA